MSKELKSFHKLFFIVIFCIFFSGIVGNTNEPSLPEKIAPELEKIESLPRRTKPAELNIEITKIKSEVLEEFYIDRSNKNIYVDFSKKKEPNPAEVRNVEDLNNKYSLLISDTLQSGGEVVGKQKTKIRKNSKIMNYEMAEIKGKKMLKIPYENEPEKLYISVQENSKKEIVKVYSMDIKGNIPLATGFPGIMSPGEDVFYDEPGLILPEGAPKYIWKKEVGAYIEGGGPLEFPLAVIDPKTMPVEVMDTGGLIELPPSQRLITKYKSGASAASGITFDVELYLTDLVFPSDTSHLVRRVAGTTDRYTAIGAYGHNVNELVKAKMVGQIQESDSGIFLKILTKFRESQDTSWSFFSEEYNSRLQFVSAIGEYNAGKFKVSTGVSTGGGPGIFVFLKKNLGEDLTLTVSGEDTRFNFSESGLIDHNQATLSPGNLYMKSLNLTPTSFSLNGGAKSPIDESGSSSQANVTINNGSNELILTISYYKGYPVLSIINSPKAGTYKLEVKHYEPSGLVRLNYNLDIVIEKDYPIYDEPQIIYNLQDVVIEDKPGISQGAIPEFPLGNIGIDEYNGKFGQFPFIAFGKQAPINDPSRESWAFNLNSSNLNFMENRKSVITAYENSKYSKVLNMDMYFLDNFAIQNATKTLKSKVIGGPGGLRYNFLAAYGEDSSEKIKANDVRMQVNQSSSGIITDIINEFRKSTDMEWKFNSQDLEQITFGLGEYDKINDKYRVYDGKYLKNYPSIIFRKTQLNEELTLTLTKDLKWDDLANNPNLPAYGKIFVFEKTGINVPGATLTLGNLYLRPLLEGISSYTLNGSEQIQIDNLGNSQGQSVVLKAIAGNHDMKVFTIYQKGNFELRIYLNGKIAKGIYPMDIKIYEPSGLVRANYKLNIVIEEDQYIGTASMTTGVYGSTEFEDMPGMSLPLGAPEIKIGESNVALNQDTNPSVEMFPVIGIGQPDPVNDSNHIGWQFDLTRAELSKMQYRKPVYTTYEHTRKDDNNVGPFFSKKIDMEIYFNDNISLINSDMTLISKSESGKNNFIGSIKYGGHYEQINIREIKGQIQNTSSGILLEILKAFRESDNMFWSFSSKDQHQLTMQKAAFYPGATSAEDRFVVKPPTDTTKMQYPYLGFRKRNLSENLTLTLSDEEYNFVNPIIFTESGIVSVPGGTLSSGTLYFKSLGLTPTTFGLNGGMERYDIDASGNSSDALVTINNGTSDLVLKIKYTNEYPTLNVLNNPKPGTYFLNIKHYEASGMERLNYNLNIVIEPVKEFEVTSSMNNIIISPPTELGKSPTIQYPNNWIKVVQLVSTKLKFPVIGVNKPKWVIEETGTPLNPTDERPLAALNLDGKIITVPVNIKETPYQNVEKFFIYDRGDMTNRNLAVGAYTSLNSLSGSGKNNQIKVSFEMLLESEHIKEILDYAANQKKDIVEIPYASSQDSTIYSIRGLQNSVSKKFTVNEANILSYGIVPFPKIVVLNNIITNKNLEIELLPSYTSGEKIIFDSNAAPVYNSSQIAINPSNDNSIMEGLNYEHIVRITLPNGVKKDYITESNGSVSIIETIESNGQSLKLNIDYTSSNQVQVWADNRTGAQIYNLVLEHVDLSGKVIKTINMLINSILTTKSGEMDLVISSRYNAAESGLNSNPLGITTSGIIYQSQVLDLNLLSGIYPKSPGKMKEVYVNDNSLASLGSKGEITLTNGTILKITQESNGDLKIKPLYWKNNSIDVFKLTYKNGGVVTDEYTFNVKCPNFFVASIGELDFGILYKNIQYITKTTSIELQYNSSSVNSTYSLDVTQPNPDGSMTNSLYLNDDKTLLVKDLYLGDEVVNSLDKTKRTIPLTGTIDGASVKNTPEGTYQKTIQILIHLK